jgi:DNA processing protein
VLVRPSHRASAVASELDLVALSLLWTEGAERKPARHADQANPESPDVLAPDPRTLTDLDEVLDRLRARDARAKAAALRRRATAAMEAARRGGIGVLPRGDAEYPFRLETIVDPPPVLWVRGLPGRCRFAVAIVGSRFATRQGLEVAFRLGQDLARAGFDVVSGLARGVDAAAHRGALRAGGRTIAVLGCGADVIYPPEHAPLTEAIAAEGALITEFAPGVPPRGWHFPRRNRIISGVSLGVVIVEAAQRSGSLITARCALEQGRSVMAVPGAVLGGRNRGAHGLIRDGAGVVEEARHIVEQLQADWPREFAAEYGPGAAADPESSGSESGPPSRSGSGPGAAVPGSDPILRAMRPGETYRLEDLEAETGLAAVPLMARLTRLEVDGWVARAEGGRFVKAGPNVLR